MDNDLLTTIDNYKKQRIDWKDSSSGQNYFDVHYYRIIQTFKLMHPYIKTDMVILDVGSSPPIIKEILESLRIKVIGIDYEPEHEPDDNAIMCNIEKESLPFTSNYFDAITFFEILEHLIINPIKALQECLRVLKPDGYLFLSTPNSVKIRNLDSFLRRTSYFQYMYRDWKKFYSMEHYEKHHYEYTMDELVDLLNQIPLKVINNKYRAYRKSTFRHSLTPTGHLDLLHFTSLSIVPRSISPFPDLPT